MQAEITGLKLALSLYLRLPQIVDPSMCEHLQPLEDYLNSKKIPETFRGQAWSDNCREWVYFDCVLDPENLKAKFHLPSFVTRHENTDEKSGTELGLVCNQCKDAIMGLHPRHSSPSKPVIS